MRWKASLSAGAVALVAASAPGVAATAEEDGFVEPVDVLYTLSGGSPGTGAFFGWAVSELGDVDGDGATDVVVGEPFTATGTTWVHSGRSGGLLYRLDGAPGDQQGYAIADAGDTDADGVPDVVSGAPGVGRGRAYLYSGATGDLLRTFSRGRAGDSFGAAVAGAGDVNRDGHADVLVGAPGNDGGGVDSGRAYVFSGRTGKLLRKLDAGDEGDLFGSATDWSSDLDGDGRPELIVGAQDADPEERGKAYVFSGRNGRLLFTFPAPASGVELGSFFVAGPGDVDGDGTPDVYAADYADGSLGPGTGRAAVYSGADGSELRSWVGSEAGEGLGPGREAGDVDGDGLVDLAIGSYTSSDGAEQAGKVEIFSGADGSLVRRITSTTPFENLGFDAVGVGDLDGDGVPDLLASAASGDRVYVIAGERR
ncbi:MAG TPA: FG-GAP-like repeat-containing protein [Gaiellaceae bacterium]|nr:FG-GAP-like repeat-containing protein [Gaiellaceae bacterium]